MSIGSSPIQLSVQINGMTCSACSATIERVFFFFFFFLFVFFVMICFSGLKRLEWDF